MKKNLPVLPVFAFVIPFVASAYTLGNILDDMAGVVINVIPVLLSLAVLVFFWGIVKFISNAGDEKVIEEGKQLMLWGMISIFVMIALWGIIGWLQAQFGLDVGGSLGNMSEQSGTIPVPAPL